MRNLKIFSALALAGLTTVTLTACTNDDNQATPPPSNSTSDNYEEEVNKGILEYAKSDAITDVTSYASNILTLSGYLENVEIKGKVDESLAAVKSKINEAKTTGEIDTATAAFEKEVLSIIENYEKQTAAKLEEAITTAKKNFEDRSQNGLYINTSDDGSVASFRQYATKTFAKATSIDELTVMYTEADAVLTQLFETLLNNSFIDITTPEELQAMETGKNYRLANDLDFVDIKVTVGSAIDYAGVFDGNGYTIKNWNITEAAANKRGLLFKNVGANSVIRNVRFMNCSHTGTQEGIALIAGEAEKTTFRNIEFYGCGVDSGTKSYAGLLIGRKTHHSVTVDQITVKGNTNISANYCGGLIGDARDLSSEGSVTFTNIDIDMNMNVVGNTGGILIGRMDNSVGKVVVENARINANITGTSSKAGALFDGSVEFSQGYTCNNVLLSGSAGKGITSDFFVGQKYGPTEHANIYYKEGKLDAVNKSGIPQAIKEEQLTADWYYDTLKFDRTAWVTESNGSIKLKGASSNVIEDGATLESIEVFESRAKTYYYFGDKFNADNLVVIGTYKNSDGNVLQATLSTVEVANLGSYQVSPNDFNSEKAGTYTINVVANKKFIEDPNPDDDITGWQVTDDYKVTVNTIKDLNVYDEQSNRIFLKGEDFNTDGLVVKAVYSNDDTTTVDDVESTMHNTTEKTFYEVDSQAFKKDTVGKYEIKVSTTENKTKFEGTYIVEVVDKIDVAGLKTVSVTVDSTALETVVDTVNKTATFNSINKALDYLASLGLEDSVKKVINLKDGTYEEKITVNMNNVSFVGTTEEKSIITYGACAGFKYLDETLGNYGTDNSATVIVKGSGFMAKNVTFVNSFDYNNDNSTSDKQALAIGVYADDALFYNCSFKGFQDTLQTKSGRSYFYECYIEGNVDFIFGVDCTAYFEKCEIKSLNRNSDSNGGYIVAPKTSLNYTYGFYFNGCKFTAEEGVVDGTVSIARPWGADGTCVVINSELGSHISKLGYSDATNTNSRYEDMSGNKPMNANFKEYNNTGAGAITEAVEGCSLLTEAEASALVKLENLFKESTADGFGYWDASKALEELMK